MPRGKKAAPSSATMKALADLQKFLEQTKDALGEKKVGAVLEALGVQASDPELQLIAETLQPLLASGKIKLGNPAGYTLNKGRNKNSPSYNKVTVKANPRKPAGTTGKKRGKKSN